MVVWIADRKTSPHCHCSSTGPPPLVAPKLIIYCMRKTQTPPRFFARNPNRYTATGLLHSAVIAFPRRLWGTHRFSFERKTITWVHRLFGHPNHCKSPPFFFSYRTVGFYIINPSNSIRFEPAKQGHSATPCFTKHLVTCINGQSNKLLLIAPLANGVLIGF